MALELDETSALLKEVWTALNGAPEAMKRVRIAGAGSLPSVFAVSSLAAAAFATAGLAASEFIADLGRPAPGLLVDRRLASFWFAMGSRPQGWKPASPWNAIAGDYQGADGWIRLHTNAPHHCAVALKVLGCPEETSAVASAVARWKVGALEAAIVAAGGCAAEMRSASAWAAHRQGAAVAAEPLIHIEAWSGDAPPVLGTAGRPLAGVRVLDLTRVLAGPMASRFLAGLGADVLRIDPPWWDEDSIVHEVTRGKRCARLDLREAEQRATLTALLKRADVMIHGYRPGALDGLGLGADARRRINPTLVDVSLDAYGWTGPWAERRGFDSLVQMSSGIAEAGMRVTGRDRPTPLPVQALDHAQGYLLAASALRGLSHRNRQGGGWRSRSSLARVAALLLRHPADFAAPEFAPETPADLADEAEESVWGRLAWLKPPVEIEGAPLRWDRPSGPLGEEPAAWG